MNSFFDLEELKTIGFKKVGANVLISRKTSIYAPHLIEIGDHVRIDDYCILSGEIKLGSYIHISAYTALYAKFGLVIDDYATISGRVFIYTQNDDYSGEFMTNPMIPSEFTNVTGGKVFIAKHVIIGSGSIILPGVSLGTGACLGAMSLLKTDIPSWQTFAGVPARKISDRSNNLLKFNF